MGLYRDETGAVIEIDDGFAEARGYAPVTVAEEVSDFSMQADKERAAELGEGGTVNTVIGGIASGVSLGMSDALLGKVMSPAQREQVLAEMEAHPYARMGGEIAGTLAGAVATGGSSLARTPAGYLSALAQREVEAGLAIGGVKGTAKALGVMGTEGALQSAGQYIGHASLQDKEATAEGLAGALGTGFTFGAAGGGAALGVANGVIAGRRLYSRVMGGQKAAEEAASSWSTASQQALEADMSTARTAEVKLENIRKAKMEALRGRNEARSAAQEASLDARGARVAKPKEVPDFEAGIPTDVRATPASVVDEFTGPEPLIDVGAQPRGGMPTSVFKAKPAEIGPATKLDVTDGMERYRGVDVEGDLEAQLAGTKSALDEGASLKQVGEQAQPGSAVSPQIPRDKTPPVQPGRQHNKAINDWLAEKSAFDDAPDSLVQKMADANDPAKLADIKSRFPNLEPMDVAKVLRKERQEALSEIRYKATEDLLGPQIAKEEQRVADLMDEYKDARKDFEEIIAVRDAEGPPTRGGRADPDATGVQSPGKRQAIEILDNAHEEALLRAKHASDPAEAGTAITEAEELEKMLEDLSTPRLHAADQPMSRGELRSQHSKKWADELAEHAEKVKRYEKASAALTEEMGDMAHPVSAEKTKMLREAERDSERKMYDRATRAVDDTDIGLGEHPKVSAAKAAKRKQLEAQRTLDESNASFQEAKHELTGANKKVREGEKLKKAALRDDAKLAGVGARAGGIGAQDVGGIAEMIDIPGMPKPSDLPVIGPLLGAYLKFRTIKKSLGGAMGKVPATADARVAALASQTRDRVARAVDRSIGALERGARSATKVIPPVAGVLANRIYDDGHPEVKKGADIQDLAAARMRELAAYVHTPGAIERDVRRQLAEVTDPDLITAAENQRRAAMEYLLSVAPKVPEPNLLNPVPYRPAGAQAMSFARSMAAVHDPASVFEALEHEQAMISLEAARALRQVYPRIFSEAGMRLMERAQRGDLKVPSRTRIQLSLLYNVPLDAALDPDNLRITQSVYERKTMMPPPGMQGVPTQPSIANPVNLSQGLTPSVDRR